MRSSRPATAASCRSTARERWRSPASTSTSAAPTRNPRAMPAGASPSARASGRLWAKMHNAPISQAPILPDSTLDQIVSSINVEREEIGPNRYIADLGILFDRARAAQFLGVEGGEVQRSAPMLLIPVTVSAGTETSVELKNAWQRAWAISGPRKARSIMCGSAASASTRCWSTPPRSRALDAAGGATSSISMARPTSSSPRSSSSGSIRAGRRGAGSSPVTAPTAKSSAASR